MRGPERAGQPGDDRLREVEGQDEAHPHRDEADEDPVAQLAQVGEEGHPALAALLLRASAPTQETVQHPVRHGQPPHQASTKWRSGPTPLPRANPWRMAAVT